MLAEKVFKLTFLHSFQVFIESLPYGKPSGDHFYFLSWS